MPASYEPSSIADLPAPTPELALLFALVEAYVATQPRDEALAFLRAVADVLATREEFARNIVAIRKPERELARRGAAANRQALAAFRKLLERCIGRVAPRPVDDDDDA